MGLFDFLTRLRGRAGRVDGVEPCGWARLQRRCQIERLESRQMMAADIHLGAVYFDPASGTDTVPNQFTVTFQGGAAGTQLSQVEINLDKNLNGSIDDGESFFNTTTSPPGVYGSSGFSLVSIDGGASVGSVSVVNGGQQLVINLSNFASGDTLKFTIDVDEQGVDSHGNQAVSAVVEGAEFEGSILTGTFTNPDYYSVTGSDIFVDQFNPRLQASGLNLPPDNYEPPSVVDETVLTAGAMFPLTQTPLPSSIAGNVRYTTNGAWNDPLASTLPINNVTVELEDTSGHILATTDTDASGNYLFNNLGPGTYRVVELQPAGYYEGGSYLGSLGGTQTNIDQFDNIVLVANNHGVHYDFVEQLGVGVSGHVVVVTNGDCDDPAATHTPAANVTLQLVDSSGNAVLDSFGHAITTTTDSTGYYNFTSLPPGTYGVREVPPTGYIAGCDFVGTVNGSSVGNNPNETNLTSIALTSGQAGINYDFHLLLPVTISGHVDLETLGNCVNPANVFTNMPGVTVMLVDGNGNAVLDGGGHAITTTTDANGNYAFTNLPPSSQGSNPQPTAYGVHIVVPTGYYEDYATLGTVAGSPEGAVTSATALDDAVIWSGQAGINYNFVILPPPTISGAVMVDPNQQYLTNPNQTGLGGVEVELIDALGSVIATTLTAADGTYSFTNMPPGTYSVVEVAPGNYLEEAATPGCNGGIVPNTHTITTIPLPPGGTPTHYNFYLIPQATISGYVFQDGPTIVTTNVVNSLSDLDPALLAGHTGARTPDDTMLGGVALVLTTSTGTVLATTTTDSSGFYSFAGLNPGTYDVFVVEPSGYFAYINTAGSTGGVAAAIGGFSIIDIPVAGGQTSLENDFSVVQVGTQFFLPLAPPPSVPLLAPAAAPAIPTPPPTPPAPALIPPPATPDLSGSDVIGFTWHLSVINAGQPRSNQVLGEQVAQLVAQETREEDAENIWQESMANTARWLLRTGEGEVQELVFGTSGSLPLVGDFDGDGRTDVGVFVGGRWYIDLNGNGQWDKGDLWARMGHQDDLPTAGDWDGDGKSDIAIFGRAWPGDPNAIAHDPGLPNPDNPDHTDRDKNIPPTVQQATTGMRVMRRTSAGKLRADLIDHVFLYGAPGDQPIAGNFNGSGIDTIGVFRDGRWDLDMDGDGTFNDHDMTLFLGQHGDKPVIGDFDGDGQDELGIYRGGVWLIDANHNYRIDEGDTTIHLGGPGDLPVVGDWNGDGRDDPGVFQPLAGATAPAAANAAAAAPAGE